MSDAKNNSKQNNNGKDNEVEETKLIKEEIKDLKCKIDKFSKGELHNNICDTKKEVESLIEKQKLNRWSYFIPVVLLIVIIITPFLIELLYSTYSKPAEWFTYLTAIIVILFSICIIIGFFIIKSKRDKIISKYQHKLYLLKLFNVIQDEGNPNTVDAKRSFYHQLLASPFDDCEYDE